MCYLIFFILCFLKATKNYFKNKNKFLLSSLLFCLIYLNPILPSGSFFTTYSATIFWINFALMITFVKRVKCLGFGTQDKIEMDGRQELSQTQVICPD